MGKYFCELDYLLVFWGVEIKFWDYVEVFVECFFFRDCVNFYCVKEMYIFDN